MYLSTMAMNMVRSLEVRDRTGQRIVVTCVFFVAIAVGLVFALTQPATPASATADSRGYITFCINVHDFFHVEESADILLRLIDLFESHGVRGDFYLTAPMAHFYVEERPDVISRLRDSEMAISFHLRPPHPAYSGFDTQLKGLGPTKLEGTLRDYETYRLDLTTGGLIYDESGGVAYMTETFGKPPSAASIPFERWRSNLLPIWHDMGAQMTVTYHETGTDLENPYVWRDGLLIRPSDFSITRWPSAGNGNDEFWWNMLGTPLADAYVPVDRLQEELDAWNAERPPFITVLIHENNFYRRLATPWAHVFYEDAKKETPREPPFDLDTPDASIARTDENMAAIWSAYENLVAYAAEHLIVVTSSDIVQLARASRD